jgi:hypothetical protein
MPGAAAFNFGFGAVAAAAAAAGEGARARADAARGAGLDADTGFRPTDLRVFAAAEGAAVPPSLPEPDCELDIAPISASLSKCSHCLSPMILAIYRKSSSDFSKILISDMFHRLFE